MGSLGRQKLASKNVDSYGDPLSFPSILFRFVTKFCVLLLGNRDTVAYIIPEKSRILWHTIEVGKLSHFYQETKKNFNVSSDFASSIQMRRIYSQ